MGNGHQESSSPDSIYVELALEGGSDEEICSLGDYYSWNQWKHSSGGLPYPEWSSKILDLKGKGEWVNVFDYHINNLVQSGISIARVPGHDLCRPLVDDPILSKMRFANGGLDKLVSSLASKKNRNDVSMCLERVKKIKKLSARGDRSPEVHFGSIEVRNKELIDQKNILLIDDVTTSGNSLKACRELLLRGGAYRVKMLALGKTVRAT